MIRSINNVSSKAVEDATGKSWDEWVQFIDRQGGAKLDHKAIVKLVKSKGKLTSGWWQQMVTVGYEHAKGRRQTGETAAAGFQVGVQQAIALGRRQLWELLTSKAGLRAWLGGTSNLKLEPGARFATRTGLTGQIRSLKPGHRLRLTYQPKNRKQATMLQMTLSCPRNTRTKTTLRFHHEKLASKTERERMRAHWKAVLDELVALGARSDR